MMGKFLNHWDVQVAPEHFDDFALMGNHGYWDTPFNVNGDVRSVNRYSTDFVADRAVRFIDVGESADADPWFLYVAPFTPHLSGEVNAVEESYQDAPIGKWDGNPAVLEKARSDKPPYVQDANLTLKGGQHLRAKQLRLLMSLDDLVHDVMAALSQNQEINDTLALFVTDNGFNWAEHALGGKGVPYTPSIRVPLFMRWPTGSVGIGQKDGRVAANVDVAPTILDAAGVDPGYEMDGRSLLDTWTRDRMFFESWPSPGSPAPQWASIRTNDYQYVEYYTFGGDVSFREYYSLQDDPWQLHNLLKPGNTADDPAGLAPIQAQLAADRNCHGTGPPQPCP
jgi:arylsulfatase A-like enzyme